MALPKPNVRLSSDPRLFESLSFVCVGNLRIVLPDIETQRRGFYSEHARKLVQVVPGFKFFISRR